MKVVFVINSLTHYHILSDYIKFLGGIQKYELSSILVNKELASKEAYLEQYSKVIKLFEMNSDIKNKGNYDSEVKKKSGSKPIFFYWLYFIYLFWKHIKLQNKCNAIINSIQPDIAVISSDRYTSFDLFFAKICNKKKIKVVVLGIDYFYVESFESYLRSNSKRKITTIWQKVTAKFFPKQIFKVNNEKCLYYPAHLIWNLFLMNSLPKMPYLTGSRFVDQIHVDCELTKKKYLEFGIDENKIKVNGLLEHDLIFSAFQNKKTIKDSFHLDILKKTIVLAVPQGYEHHLISKELHFEIIESIIKAILKYPVNLVLSLHPKMDINNYLFLEEKYQLQISRKSLRDFIVISDLFISTYSSTVLWSSLLKIPCLIFDLYNLNYDCYRELKNVKCTIGLKDFEQNLEIKFNLLSSSNIESSFDNNYGVLDNKAFNRFEMSINEK